MMRAPASGIRLTKPDAAIAKGMLLRGDRQSDIAAWFGCNAGRIAEIATGATFASTMAAEQSDLPPRGPYVARDLIGALTRARAALGTTVDG
jgi:hypothetical protein